MYVITAATGNIGKVVTKNLLAQGKKVRVVGRNAEKLQEFVSQGAEAAVGDVNDAAFVLKAFENAKAVFCLLPPNPHSNNFRSEQKKISTNYANAAKANNVKYAVLLSSIGAHLRHGAGIVDGLGDMEESFLALRDVNVLNLRPTYFMENILGQVGIIRQMGIAGSPVKGDLAIPMVAIKDIVAVASKRLSDLNFTGNTVEYILGPRDLSYNEIAKIIGNAIGKPDLKYVQFPYADAIRGMVESGFCSENVATSMTDMAEGLNNGLMGSEVKRTPENTTPTSIEDFAKTFAYVYNS